MPTIRIPRRRRSIVEVSSLEARKLFCSQHDLGFYSTTPLPDGATAIDVESSPTTNALIDQINVPAYSSRPGAAKKLYLDFNGQHTIEGWGGWWEFGGRDAGPTSGYDIDDNQLSYSYQERVNIEKIWKGVAEKFSPFNIDVTTVKPSNMSVGTTGVVVIGGDGSWYGSGGGVALRDGFHGIADPFDVNGQNYSFVWANPTNPTYMAEAVAHEAGHMFGLKHQSFAPIATNEYADGFIMGSGDAGIGRWTNTAISGTIATTRDDDGVHNEGSQDDLAILVGENGFGYRADDHVSTISGATTIPLTLVSGVLGGATSGVITPSDSDMFRIVHNGGSLEMEVLAAEFRGMLDPQMTLWSSAGNSMQTSNTDDGSDGVGEKISFSSLAAGTYYVSVSSEGGYGNIGQYRLNVRAGMTNTTANNTMSTATVLGLHGDTGATAIQVGFAGTANVAESVQSSDIVDFFRVKLPANTRNVYARLSSPSSSADVTIIGDANGDGLISSNEALSTSGGGTNIQSLSLGNTVVGGGDTLFFRVRNLGGGNGNYTLNITADTAPATLPPTTTPATFDQTPFRGGKWIYESIDPLAGDTVDYYRLKPAFNGHVSFYGYVVNGDIQVALGVDANNNGVLDSGEVLANGNASDYAESIAVNANANVLIRVQGSVASNYSLFTMIDYPTAGNQTGTLNGAFVLPSTKTGTFDEYLGYGPDLYDTYRFNPVAGLFHAKLTNTDIGLSHRLQIIQDTNTNGVVDAGEIVANGLGELTYNITTFANYYLRVLPDFGGGEFGSIGNYRLKWWDGSSVEPPSAPTSGTLALSPSNTTVNGYLGYNPLAPELNDTDDLYTFTVTTRTRFDVSLNNPQFGLQIRQAANGVYQKIAGLGTYQGVRNSMSVNLDPGTYQVRAYLPVGEREDRVLGGDYAMTYKTAAITDNAPPVVVSSGFQYEVKSNGVYFIMDQDVGGTVDLSDATVVGLTNGFTFPLSTAHYDPATKTIAFSFTAPVLPDGRYRATLNAGSVRDNSNNPLATAVSFEFNVLTGDFNRDGSVNFSDLLTLAQNYGTSNAVFSRGDANYDRVVDFSDLLLMAQRYGSSIFSSDLIIGSDVGRKDRNGSDVLRQL